MHVWVTRAEPGASATAARISAMGHTPFTWPLLEVRPLETSIDLDDVAALAFTSANAVAVFAAREPRRDLPVFTVGDATAEAARIAGFDGVASADGDVAALTALIAERRPGLVLHPRAREPAGDLAGDLQQLGLPARSLAVYETVPRPPPNSIAGLDAVLVHSPRAARLLAELPQAAGLLVLALSSAAAAPLTARNFPRLLTAAFPKEAALLKLLADTTCEGS